MSNPDPGGGGLREKSGGGGPAMEGEKSEGTSGGIVIGNGCSIGPGGPEKNMKGIVTLKHIFPFDALLRNAYWHRLNMEVDLQSLFGLHVP